MARLEGHRERGKKIPLLKMPRDNRFYPILAHSFLLPFIFSMAWGRTGSMTSKFSFTADGLPGRLMISVFPFTPATALEIIARGVFLSPLYLMASGMPGISRVIISSVASGVTSRGEGPVPPVVRIRSTLLHKESSFFLISAFSSGRMS